MDQRLFEYVRQAKASGLSENQIRGELLKIGWPALEVESALRNISSISPDSPNKKHSGFFGNLVIGLLILTMVGGAAFGFWKLDQKIKSEGPKVPFGGSTTTSTIQATPSTTLQDKTIAEIPEDYQLDKAWFSSDGSKVICSIGKAGQKFILMDGLRSEAYDAVENCQFNSSGNHFFCVAAAKDKKKTVIFDGKSGKQYDSLIKEPFFSAGGEGLIYAATVGTDKFLVLDDQENPLPYDSVGKLVISPNLDHIVYIGVRGKNQFLAIDGQETRIEGTSYSDPVFISNNKVGYGIGLNGELIWKEAEVK